MHQLCLTNSRRWKVFGPVFLSALSFSVSFIITQPIALALDSNLSLFANKGLGKIGLTIMVILQALILVLSQKNFAPTFLRINISFIFKKNWLKDFFTFFFFGFFLHFLFLNILPLADSVTYNTNWLAPLKTTLFFSLLFGFVATFFLAWTEELIFRGTIYPFFAQELSPISSAFFTSLIFMAAHDLHNPINLISSQWRLGFGLFLLGFLLNLIFIITQKLYIGMGMHAGLVFVKVVFRRIPFLFFSQETLFPWWLNKDLRQAAIIHVVFVLIIITIVVWKKNIFFKKAQNQ